MIVMTNELPSFLRLDFPDQFYSESYYPFYNALMSHSIIEWHSIGVRESAAMIIILAADHEASFMTVHVVMIPSWPRDTDHTTSSFFNDSSFLILIFWTPSARLSSRSYGQPSWSSRMIFNSFTALGDLIRWWEIHPFLFPKKSVPLSRSRIMVVFAPSASRVSS